MEAIQTAWLGVSEQQLTQERDDTNVAGDTSWGSKVHVIRLLTPLQSSFSNEENLVVANYSLPDVGTSNIPSLI